jgi:hypothetical protein
MCPDGCLEAQIVDSSALNRGEVRLSCKRGPNILLLVYSPTTPGGGPSWTPSRYTVLARPRAGASRRKTRHEIGQHRLTAEVPLTEILRQRAQRLLAQGIEASVDKPRGAAPWLYLCDMTMTGTANTLSWN